MKLVINTLWGIALTSLLGCGGGGGEEQPPQPPPDVTVETITTGPIQDRISSVGTLQANEEVTLMPELDGQVTQIHFEEGQSVREGDLLIELERERETAELAQVKAEVDLAQQNLKRARALAGGKAMSLQEIDQIESQMALKEALYEFQEKRFNETYIRSPFAGTLGPRMISRGQFVSRGQSLVKLTDAHQIKVTYKIPERHLSQLKVDQTVLIRVAAYPDRTFEGKVDLIHPEVDANTRTIEVRAIAGNQEGLLKPGMFAKVETITSQRDRAVIIPEKAVVPSLTGFAVYLVETNTALQTPVTLGMRLPGKVEIVSGVQAGQKVIVEGIQNVQDGAPVNPTPSGENTEDQEPETSNP